MDIFVMFSGKLRSGKNTVSSMFKEEMAKKGLVVEERYLAKVLKENCRDDFKALSNFLSGLWEDIETRLPPDIRGKLSWMDVKDEHFFEDKTPLTRHLLQIYGLEIFRNRVDQDYWIKAFIDSVADCSASIVTVTDCRFPGEIACTSRSPRIPKPVVVRVERPGYAQEEGQGHPSETALDGYNGFHHIIVNDGDLLSLRLKVQEIVSSLVSP